MTMSVTGGAGSRTRTNKEKVSTQSKPESHSIKSKVQQVTPEQIRLAEMIDNTDDAAVMQNIQQLVELTGKSHDEVAVALHDALNDPDRAYVLIVEGETANSGEWHEGGKKKKPRSTPQPATVSAKDGDVMNHVGHRGDSTEKENDRSDTVFSRKNRPNEPRPPRLSKGRGRDRGNVHNETTEDGEEKEVRSQSRGRGRGSRGPGRGASRGSTSRRGRFEKPVSLSDQGPEIDLWTNETAENAQKDKNIATEDWDDIWTGGLEESKIFMGSGTPPAAVGADSGDIHDVLMDVANGLGSGPQRINLSELLPNAGLMSDSGYMNQIDNFVVPASNEQKDFTAQNSGNSYIMNASDSTNLNQFKRTATESIKNSIGIGSSTRSNQVPGNAMLGTQCLDHVNTGTSSPPGFSLQQRSKPQRSRMPAPSKKIPASAVEMPGHESSSSVDIQFGADSFVFPAGSSESSSLYSLPQSSSSSQTPNSSDGQRTMLSGHAPYSASVSSNDLATQISAASGERSHLSQLSDHGSSTDNVSGKAVFGHSGSSYKTSNSFSSSTNMSQTAQYTQQAMSGQYNGSQYQYPAVISSAQYRDTMNQYGTSQFSGVGAQDSYISQYSAALPTTQYSGSTPDQSSMYSYQQNTFSESADLYGVQQGVNFHTDTSYKGASATQSGGSRYRDDQSHSSSASTSSMYGSRDQGSLPSSLTNRDGYSALEQYSGGSASSGAYHRGESQLRSGQNYNIASAGAATSYLHSDSINNQSAYGRESYSRDSQNSGSSSLNSYTRDQPNTSVYHHDSSSTGAPITSMHTNQSFVRESNVSGQAADSNALYGSHDSKQSSVYTPQTVNGTFGSQVQPGFPVKGSAHYGSTTQNSTSAFISTQNSAKIGSYGAPSKLQNSAGSYGSMSSQTAGPSYNLQTTSSDVLHSSSSNVVSTTKTTFDSTLTTSYSTQSGYTTQSHSSMYSQLLANTVASPIRPQNYLFSAQNVGLGFDTQNMPFVLNPQLQNMPGFSSQNYGMPTYNSGHYGGNGNFLSNLQSNKLSENFSKMSVKDTNVSASSINSGSTVSSTSSLTPSSSSAHSSSATSNIRPILPSSKGSGGLMQIPMLNSYIMSQPGMAPYFPMYQPYDDVGVMQQSHSLPLGNYYDINYASPTGGRDQGALASIPYTGADGKATQVEAQSPNASSQNPVAAQSAHQHTFLNPAHMPPGYIFPLTPQFNFQYHFMPPVTNAPGAVPHGGTTGTNLQYQKSYSSYGATKGFDDMNHAAEFSKSAAYPSQATKVSSGSGVTGLADLTAAAQYGKAHATQAYDKQGFHTATPPPFNLQGIPAGSQLNALTNPYAYHLMTPHSQLIHPQLQQETAGSRGSQQASSTVKSRSTQGQQHYWNP